MALARGAVPRPFRLEATPLALPVELSSDPRVPATIGQLRGDPKAAQEEKGGEDSRHRRQRHRLHRRDGGDDSEEGVENDGPKGQEPNRTPQPSQQPLLLEPFRTGLLIRSQYSNRYPQKVRR